MSGASYFPKEFRNALARFFLQAIYKTERLMRAFSIAVTESFPFAGQLADIPSFVLIILLLHYLLRVNFGSASAR
jgi:hypothetical protein